MHRAQNAKPLEGLEHVAHPLGVALGILFRRTGLHEAQIVRIRSLAAGAQRQRANSLGRGRLKGEQRTGFVVASIFAIRCRAGTRPYKFLGQDSASRRRIAPVHGLRQLANGPFEAAALAQHHSLLGQHGRGMGQAFSGQGLPRHSLHKLRRGPAVATRCRVVAQVAQHRTRFNRSQLVFVA